MTTHNENEQWTKKVQKDITDWLMVHENNLMQWIDENEVFFYNQLEQWKEINESKIKTFKNNIQKDFKNWIKSNFESDVSLSTLVFDKLENFYLLHRNSKRNCIPHYYNWVKPNYGVLFPIFTKTENKPLPTLIEPKGIDYHVKQHAKKVYEKEFYDLGELPSYQTYYSLLTDILCNSPEMLLLDMNISYHCNQKRKTGKQIELYCDKKTIKQDNTKCDWMYNTKHKVTYGALKDVSTYDFITFVKQRLEKETITIPHDFNYFVTNDALVLEENFKEIQRELIYNDKLRNYFKFDSQTDDKAFYYKEACKRIKKMYPEPAEFSTYSTTEQEEYVYMIEKLTGINLAHCYTYYYSKIKKLLLEQKVSKKRAEHLLLWVLDEFIDLPNILTRIQIVKEYMEPLLFLDENVEEKLCHVKEETRQLKIHLGLKWEAIYTCSDTDSILKNVDVMDYDIDDLIRYNETDTLPVIYTDNADDIITADFAIVFKYILKKINLQHIIKTRICQSNS